MKYELDNIDNLLKQITIKDYPFDNEKTLSLLENSDNLSEVDSKNNTENISKLPEKIIPSRFAQNSNWLGNVMITIMQYKVIIMNLLILTSLVGLVSLFYNSASDENTILTNKSDTTQTTLTISGFSVSDTLNSVILSDTNVNSQQSGLVILSGQVEEKKDSIKDIEDKTFVLGKDGNEIIINSNGETYHFKLTQDSVVEISDGKTTQRYSKNNNNPIKSKYDNLIDKKTGNTYLELEKDEFNNIVNNSFVSDTMLITYSDILIEKEEFFYKYKLDSLGFKTSELPLIMTSAFYNSNKTINKWWEYIKSTHPYPNDFDKSKYLAFAVFNERNQMVQWGEGTLLLAKYSENKKFNSYFDLYYEKDEIKIRTNTTINELNKTRNILLQELENLFYEDVIPVKVPLFDGKSVMFFFKPTEEFIAKLPERYRESIKNEVAAKRLLEQNQPFSCETKNFTTDIFALCNDTETIQNARLFPNPGGSELNLSLKVLQDRKTKIELCDFSGNLLKELMTIDFVVGEKVVNIDIDKIPMGLYFIRLSTDKGEVINLRYIKDK